MRFTRFVLLVVVSLWLTPALATAQEVAPPATDSIEGVYAGVGTNPDGKEYKSVVEIVQKDANYLVLWKLEDNTEVLGIGILTDGVLSVSYVSVVMLTDGKSRAAIASIVSYRVDGGKLVGKWSTLVRDALGDSNSETLTKMNAKPEMIPKLLNAQPEVHPEPKKTKPEPGQIVA